MFFEILIPIMISIRSQLQRLLFRPHDMFLPYEFTTDFPTRLTFPASRSHVVWRGATGLLFRATVQAVLIFLAFCWVVFELPTMQRKVTLLRIHRVCL